MVGGFWSPDKQSELGKRARGSFHGARKVGITITCNAAEPHCLETMARQYPDLLAAPLKASALVLGKQGWQRSLLALLFAYCSEMVVMTCLARTEATLKA